MNPKILFITGTRADFGKLKPLMEAVEQCREFECYIFATGMHTLARYGYTYNEIEKAGFKQIFQYINQTASSSSDMDLVLADTVKGLGYYIRESRPDLIVVHGDRVETLAGAIVGVLNNILVAHIEGGELSGTVDEFLRHSVSKLAHLHFVANEAAKNRLIQMGESPEAIFVIGSPDIDVMRSDRLPSLEEVKKRYQIPFSEYNILTYHPVTTEVHKLVRHTEAVVSAVKDSGMNFVVIYPNNDRGAEIILEALDGLREHSRFCLFPSIRFEYFLALLKHARAIVGNSSAGIREATFYGIPTVNIGTRQKNRFYCASIVQVSENRDDILQALAHLPERTVSTDFFGNGESAKKFIASLQTPRIWRIPRQKQFNDLPR